MPSSTPRSPDTSAIQRAAGSALQTRSVRVERLSGYLFRSYRLTTSTGFFYVLRSRPSHHVRLLRHEEDRLKTEAIALQALGARPDIVSARLIESHTTTIAIGSPYLISGPFAGSILADVEPTLSSNTLASIDNSLGQYVRRLSSIGGSSFGPIRQSSSSPSSASWARAYTNLMESVLRNGEDALISLPYADMRVLLRRHKGSLNRITQPRLTIIDLSADRNIMVDVKQHRVTGLLDFSTALWGDPYLSDCFYKPTASFAEGFGKLPNGDADERIRQYLYVQSMCDRSVP